MSTRLRSERKKRRWTQAKLAEKAGVHQMLISTIETRKVKNPSWKLVYRISQALGLSPEYVFPVDSPKKKAKPEPPAESPEANHVADVSKEADGGQGEGK